MKPEAEALKNVLRAEKARRPELTDAILLERMGGEMAMRPLRDILRGAREPKISELVLIARAIGVPMGKIVADVEAELARSADRASVVEAQVQRELTGGRSARKAPAKKAAKPRADKKRHVG